jgi:hypothetical protein
MFLVLGFFVCVRVCVCVCVRSVVMSELEQMCKDVREWRGASPSAFNHLGGSHGAPSTAAAAAVAAAAFSADRELTPPEALAWSSTLKVHKQPLVSLFRRRTCLPIVEPGCKESHLLRDRSLALRCFFWCCFSFVRLIPCRWL